MIPAVLSCVFVLYLYRTLGEENSGSKSIVDADSNDSGDVGLLSEQLASLNSRMDKLIQRSKGGQA